MFQAESAGTPCLDYTTNISTVHYSLDYLSNESYIGTRVT